MKKYNSIINLANKNKKISENIHNEFQNIIYYKFSSSSIIELANFSCDFFDFNSKIFLLNIYFLNFLR